MRVDVRFTRKPEGTAIELSFDRGATWAPFGDPLRPFPDDFDFHDIYHLIFKSHLGYSHVFDHLHFGVKKKDRPFLQEEAVVLNEYVPEEIRGDIHWCCGMFPTPVSPEVMQLTLTICRMLVADLVAQHRQKGYARAVVWMPDPPTQRPLI